MGSFLEKPETAKESLSGEGNGLRWALSAMQGWRMDMEDAHFAKTGLEGLPNYSFFAVFDGHGGKLASKICSEKLIVHLKSQEGFKSPDMGQLKSAITTGFLEMDKELAHMEAFRMDRDASGTTAITVLVTDKSIVCANLGDSRAVMSSGGKAIALSHDHKPTNVSRAFGDFPYKDISLAMPQEKQMVSPEPEVLVRNRDNADEFIILACDGIWDVMSNEECVAWVRDMARRYDDREKLAEKLLDHCLDKGSKDNMSVILVMLAGAPVPEPALVAEQAKRDEEDRKKREAEQEQQHGGNGGNGNSSYM